MRTNRWRVASRYGEEVHGLESIREVFSWVISASEVEVYAMVYL